MVNQHSSSAIATGPIRLPRYTVDDHSAGIVHLGIGAFHRAHQAVYTDDALATGGGNWRTVGVSMRSTKFRDNFNKSSGRFMVLERGPGADAPRLIGSISNVLAAADQMDEIMAVLCDPAIKIVSLTITEKGYGIDRTTGGNDLGHAAIAKDLANPENPESAIGILVDALRRRRFQNKPPFTILCCDNLPDNGKFLRSGVLDYASRIDPALHDWIATVVAFPATMVDRITPAPTAQTAADAEAIVSGSGPCAVETEPFSQWVIEDKFPLGRPAWEAGGALFVEDVAPYEKMKLRMLNGAHSMIAYAGFVTGHQYVRDVMADPKLRQRVELHLKAAAATLPPLAGVDYSAYADELVARFSNPTIAHETYQIAMDGTEKLPQRIFGAALDALTEGQDIHPFAFATASWMQYCRGKRPDGSQYDLRDPRADEIEPAIAKTDGSAQQIAACLHALPGLFPRQLTASKTWTDAVLDALGC